MTSGVYLIENIINGHRYVGSSEDVAKRLSEHRSRLGSGTHHNRHLQHAWDKYGPDAFQFDVLEEWEPEFLASMEQWWMNMLQPEYNICQTVLGPPRAKGSKLSDEHRVAISAGMKKAWANPATRPRLLAAQKSAAAKQRGSSHVFVNKGTEHNEFVYAGSLGFSIMPSSIRFGKELQSMTIWQNGHPLVVWY